MTVPTGYSVFVVQQIDPTAPLALARKEADELAATIPEIYSSGQQTYASNRPSVNSARAGPSQTFNYEELGDFGEEADDLDLQAALQASLGDGAASGAAGTESGGGVVEDDWVMPGARSAFGGAHAQPANDLDDPVAISARRAQEELVAFQREQQEVLREGPFYAEEVRRTEYIPSVTVSSRRARQAAPDEEEEEMLRRAIEASRNDNQPQPSVRHNARLEDDDDGDFDDPDDMEMDEDDDEHERALVQRVLLERQEREAQQRLIDEALRTATPSLPAPMLPPIPRLPAIGPIAPLSRPTNASSSSIGMEFPPQSLLDSRHYDDEDEMLQAALRASLEDAPIDFTVPIEEHKAPILPEARQGAALAVPSSSAPAQTSTARKASTEDDSEDEEEEEEEEEKETVAEPAPPPMTAEELRRARLARFGG